MQKKDPNQHEKEVENNFGCVVVCVCVCGDIFMGIDMVGSMTKSM